MISMGDPRYAYRPHSEERRARASVLAKRRLGAPPGHSIVYGVHVPDEHVPAIRDAAQKIAAKQDRVAAASFVQAKKRRGWRISAERPWTPEEEAALRRFHFDNLSSRQIAEKMGRPRNSIIGKRHRLKLISPPSGHSHFPRAQAVKLLMDHFQCPAQSREIDPGLFLIAPHFLCPTPGNIAAWANIPLQRVELFWSRMKRDGLWSNEGPLDLDRYNREGDEAAFLLVFDALLCLGEFKREVRNGEEYWDLVR